MRRPLALLPVMAIGLTLPVAAAEQDVRTAVQKECEAWNTAVKAKNASAMAALYTEKAMYIGPTGVVFGHAAIEKAYAESLKTFADIHVNCENVNMIDENAALVGGSWNATIQGARGATANTSGYWGGTYVREGGKWKLALDIYNVTPPPTTAEVQK